MNTRMIEKYYAKRRRNRALIFSLIVHAIAIIATALWLLKPLMIEHAEDSITVDFVPPSRVHRPKKIIRQVQQTAIAATASIQNPASKRLPTSTPSIPQINQKPNLEEPPLTTAIKLAPSPESILAPTNVQSLTVGRGSGTIDGRDNGQGSGKIGEGVGRRGGGSGSGLGNLAESGGGGQDAFGEGISATIGGYEDEIGDKLGSIIDEEDGIVRGHIRLIRLKHAMSD